jgi:anaphase-promoting complex subunit 2
MASAAVRAQVAAKWQESFNRLNRNEPGISGLLAFSEAWTLAIEFLKPRDLNDPTPQKQYDLNQVRAAFGVVSECRRLPVMMEVFLEDMRKSQHLITREVEAYMALYESNSDPEAIRSLVYRLVEWYNAWKPTADLGPTMISAYTLAFQTHIFSVLPPSFARGIKALVSATLQRTVSQSQDPQDRVLWQAFDTLSLIDRYETLIASIGYEFIESYVEETCARKWSEPMLATLRTWMIDKIVPWMLYPFARGATNADEAKTMMQGVGSRFDFHMHKTLCNLRTKEIFDIIVDFPESAGALQDLKECLARVDQRADLVQALRQANNKRLLHPGADTKDILTHYVSTIKCLRIVDPPGVLLFKVADPTRRYLRDRPDTIRCIVASLVGDGESGDSLVDDNDPIQPLQQPEMENYSDPEWNPEPIDAGPDFRASKSSDIISTIVSIYDTKDLFIKELQVLLAQRLLAVKDGNFDRERRNVEILKIRFGEAALQVCEVMLRDMTDSRRIDQHVQSQTASSMHPTIISRHFWPTLESSDMVMPGQFQILQEQYAKEFSVFKPDKVLRWLPHLGRVHLQLELEDRTLEADVPPLEAAFIELFSEKDVWTVDELVLRSGSVNRNAAVKALATWVDMHVLKEESEGIFRLLSVAEGPTPGSRPQAPKPAETGELPPVMSVQQQQAEQMKMYWKFIEGMLTNLGSLPLDRIQSMLKFAPGYDRTVEQLGSFMEAARRESLVNVKDGMWRLGK